MRCTRGLPWLLVVCCWQVSAAELIVNLADAQGRAVSDAVVTLVADAGGSVTQASPRAPVTRIVDQRDETFVPYVQLFTPGDKVVFRNSDTTRHHVYSFAPIKTFQFVLRPGQNSPPLLLDKAGIVAVGCNIHDEMLAYLFVSQAASIGMSDAAGHVAIDHLVEGHYTAHIWHPQLRPGEPELVRSVVIEKDADSLHLDVKLSLLPDPRKPMGRDLMGN